MGFQEAEALARGLAGKRLCRALSQTSVTLALESTGNPGPELGGEPVQTQRRPCAGKAKGRFGCWATSPASRSSRQDNPEFCRLSRALLRLTCLRRRSYALCTRHAVPATSSVGSYVCFRLCECHIMPLHSAVSPSRQRTPVKSLRGYHHASDRCTRGERKTQPAVRNGSERDKLHVPHAATGRRMLPC